MKDKMYFEVVNEECCYTLDYFQDRINDGEKEIHLQLAKRDYGSGYMWCALQGEPIMKGDGNCGKFECNDYEPRNKKSGRCVRSENCFTQTGDILILTKDGLNKKANEK